MNAEWYTAVLEEYESLRSEAVTARDAQLSVLRLSLPLLAALIGLGVSLKDNEFLGSFLLIFVVPISAIFTFELWIGEIQRSVRAGAVVGAIERRLAELPREAGTGPPMGWELWLRRPDGRWGANSISPQHREVKLRALVISGFLLVIAGIGFYLGVYLWPDGYETIRSVTITVIVAAFFFFCVRVAYAVSGLKRGNEVPDGEEIWPSGQGVESVPAA